MKENILRILSDNPKGMRKRDIAHDLGIWLCDDEFLRAMAELHFKDDLIDYWMYSDPANMEFYDVWFIKPLDK